MTLMINIDREAYVETALTKYRLKVLTGDDGTFLEIGEVGGNPRLVIMPLDDISDGIDFLTGDLDESEIGWRERAAERQSQADDERRTAILAEHDTVVAEAEAVPVEERLRLEHEKRVQEEYENWRLRGQVFDALKAMYKQGEVIDYMTAERAVIAQFPGIAPSFLEMIVRDNPFTFERWH